MNDTNYKSNGRYMELELLETYNDTQYSIGLLKEYGIKSIQGPRKISKELSNYIYDISNNYSINEKLSYEREVISIPAASTIDLIYNYRVHAHPNDERRYPYKKALFYTFREKVGLMGKLYELNKIITLNPNDTDLIEDLEIDKFSKERLKGYN